MNFIPTNEQLQEWFTGNPKYIYYDICVKLASDIRVHAEGIYPKEIIEERRPSETESVKKYREKIWVPITKPIFSKVFSSLNKIRRSSDYVIRFDNENTPRNIDQKDMLEPYIMENFPNFTNITNWAFSLLLKEYLIDANAMYCIIPIDKLLYENELIRPYPYIFTSDNIIDYSPNQYAVFRIKNKQLESTNKDRYEYYFINNTYIQLWHPIDNKGNYGIKWQYNHNIGKLPVGKLGGVVKQCIDDDIIYESRLASIVPRLDEAIREYSDLQAEVVMHIHSEWWEYGDECISCKGEGHIRASGFRGEKHICHECKGTGQKPRTPYSGMYVKPTMPGDAAPPTPPKGYIQKDVSIVTIQDERIHKHIWAALSSVNMEFLIETPLSESGKAKEIDRDEVNNFCHSIAEDIVATIDDIIYFINEMRYIQVVPNETNRLSMLPMIPVPEKFDILSSIYLEQSIATAKQSKMNPAIINEMELEYATKKFNTDNTISNRIGLIIKLDPLAGISEDDKMVRFNNNWITKESAIISANIQAFISRAIEEKGQSFYNMGLNEQKDIMLQYAQEQINANNSVAEILGTTESNNIDTDDARAQLGTTKTIANPEKAETIAKLTT